MIAHKNTIILAALALLIHSCSVAATTVTGRIVADEFATATGSLIITYQDTDDGNLMIIETTELNSANYTFSTTDGDEETPPYEKISGLIDCVNVDSGKDDVFIISGVIEGTAEDIWHRGSEQFFSVGDRFVTAIDAEKEQIGEISNLGQEADSDNSDCMFFEAKDFDLRDVASGHLAVAV